MTLKDTFTTRLCSIRRLLSLRSTPVSPHDLWACIALHFAELRCLQRSSVSCS